MIWLSLVSFFFSVMVSGAIVRWLGTRSAAYGDTMPQRFHMGQIPRLGGLALLVGTVVSWLLGVWQTQGGDPGSLHMGYWVFGWIVALLPASLGGIAEDMTQRLSVRYRLMLTLMSGEIGRAHV